MEHHEGILRYKIYHRKKSDSRNWESIIVSSLYRIFNSLEVEFYQFKVCGITGGGEGPCSRMIEIRPLARSELPNISSNFSSRLLLNVQINVLERSTIISCLIHKM